MILKVNGETSLEPEEPFLQEFHFLAHVSFIVTIIAIKALTMSIVKHKGKNLLEGLVLFSIFWYPFLLF